MTSLKKNFWSRLGVVPFITLALFTTPYAFAKDKPFTTTVLKLSDFKGRPFYEFMEAKGGLHAALNANLNEPIALIDLGKLKKIAKTEFDPSVFRKIVGMMKRGEQGFDTLFNALEAEVKAGKKITMQNIAQELRSIMTAKDLLKDAKKGGLAPLVVAPLVVMGSGGGTTVVLDEDNFFLNYDYKLGPDDEGAKELIAKIMKKDGSTEAVARKTLETAALKSGRNFGYSGSEKLLDFSDTYLLRKFDKWVDVATVEEAEKTWKVMFDIMTRSDTSGLKTLSKESQSVVTGWLTVYSAELRRHTMVRMRPSAHPWENDLTEALMASVFVKKNGGWMFADKSVRAKKPELVPGKPENFFGIGTQGSGIGVNRMERRSLQTLMTDALENAHPNEVAEIRKVIGKPRGDIFRGVMEFINNPDKQKLVTASSDRLTKAFATIMNIVGDEQRAPRLLKFFAEVGAVAPVLKDEFIPEICRTYLKH